MNVTLINNAPGITQHPAGPASASGDTRGLSRRLANGGLWSLVASVSYNGSLLAGSILTARIIGAQAYGRFSFVQNTTTMFGIFAGLGLGLTATKYLAELRMSDPERAGKIAGLTQAFGAISAAFFGFALLLVSLISSRMGLWADVQPGFQVGSLLLVANTVFGLQMGILCGFEAFAEMAVLNALRGVLCLALMVLGAKWRGESGALMGLTAASIAAGILNWRRLVSIYRRFGIRIYYRSCWEEKSILWHFSVPAMLASSFNVSGIWLITAILAARPGSYTEVGIFNAATQLRNLLIFVPNVLGQVLTPIFASVYPGRDSSLLRRLVWKTAAINALCAGGVALPLFGFGHRVLGLYGAAFTGRQTLMALTITSGIFQSLQAPAGNLISAAGRMWAGMLMYLGWGVILVGSAFVFLRFLPGAESLASAVLIAYMCHSAWTFHFAARLTRERAWTGEGRLPVMAATEPQPDLPRAI